MSQTLLLGVDGGGTSTDAWLADPEGNILGRGKAGPSNHKAVGTTAALEALDAALAEAFTDAGLDRSPAEVACLGLAGFDRPDDKAALGAWAAAGQHARRLVLVNDGDLVLTAGTPQGFGVGLIAGTGSIAVGRASGGRQARAGGWGHVFGDEGSAYKVALDALRLAARRVDGREALRVLRAKSPEGKRRPVEPGPLTDRLCAALGVSRPEDMVTAIYAPDCDRVKIAGLAPVVASVADEDPDVRSWILEPAGYDLGQTVLAVALALDWQERVLPLALAGGFLLATPIVRDALADYLRRFASFEVVSTSVPEPVKGAIVLARRAFETGEDPA